MEKSESIKNLATALVKFNSEVGKIHKKSDNPFFKSKYASLPDILSEISEPLQSAGLVVVQLPDGNSLTTMLIHSESGEYISSTAEMKPVKTDPQSLGSAITYYRRYMLGAILSLNIDEDDDGNKGSKPQPAAAKPQTQPQPTVKKELTPEQIVLQKRFNEFVTAIDLCETIEQVDANVLDAGDLMKYKKTIELVDKKKQSLTK